MLSTFSPILTVTAVLYVVMCGERQVTCIKDGQTSKSTTPSPAVSEHLARRQIKGVTNHDHSLG